MPVAPVTILDLISGDSGKPGASQDIKSFFFGFTAEHLTFKSDEHTGKKKAGYSGTLCLAGLGPLWMCESLHFTKPQCLIQTMDFSRIWQKGEKIHILE